MDPSTSVIIPVLTIVIFPEVPVSEMPVPAVTVTSVPVLELRVRGDEVPVIVRSVIPVLVDAIVSTPLSPVPVVVREIPDPSAT